MEAGTNGIGTRLREHERRLDRHEERLDTAQSERVQVFSQIAELRAAVENNAGDLAEVKDEIKTVRRSFYAVALSIVGSAVGFAFAILAAFS